ncbi:hypothetical protein AWJ20_3424 [Sugiyamaella lignohabitans]|uniref:DUF1749-domain-containing protein n=1 Tax=Sugiyamaella lignohabitans TaxID=796027 RepID=A0A161HHY5_9ASCO|nr:uncharacterized protein AWJ20_3424 [Sugiyamaella lignohabitans]ANB15780.1 hypothetical protein AWJ20_3424 [Sugiyamaella lignohabitans]
MSYPINARVHKYYSNLIAIEHYNIFEVAHDKIVIFLGGLGDGITTVPYVRHLAVELDKHGWGLVEILTTSSYTGWGTGSLVRDALEITKAIRYFKSKTGGSKAKIVVMGHSTGTQQTMYYLTQQYSTDTNDLEKRPQIDGAILQAPCSDREAYELLNGRHVYEEYLKFAKEWVHRGNGNEVLPQRFAETFFNTSVNANRWVSLMDVRGGDDYFSSDLNANDHRTTFGKVRSKLLVVFSGNDQFVPGTVDKDMLVRQWQSATVPELWSAHSGVVKGATHEVGQESEPGAREELISRVCAFLTNEVDGQ